VSGAEKLAKGEAERLERGEVEREGEPFEEKGVPKEHEVGREGIEEGREEKTGPGRKSHREIMPL
jgi:hypothetical protein